MQLVTDKKLETLIGGNSVTDCSLLKVHFFNSNINAKCYTAIQSRTLLRETSLEILSIFKKGLQDF